MKILAVDPHITKEYATAFFLDRLLFQVGYMDIHKLGKQVPHADHVYVEDQFFASNKKTLRMLSQSAGKVIGLCEYFEVPYTLVHPITWQSKAGIRLRKEGRKNKEWKDYKANLYIQKAKEIAGDDRVNIPNDDVAVAVIMAWVMGVDGDRA